MSAHPPAALWPQDLARRRDRAQLSLRACRLCPRDCGVDRHAGPTGAWCRLGADAYAYKELLSHGEEACIGPTWLIDLSGCSLRCLFCTEWAHITQPMAAPAVPLRSGWFLRRLAHHIGQGARSLSFVGGEPTVNLAAVLSVLADVPPASQLPIVWNSNGLVGEDAWPLLTDVVRTWLIDLKVSTASAATQMLGAGDLDYGARVRDTLDRVHPATPPLLTDPARGLPTLIIRHLLMPGALASETLPLLHEIAQRWPHAVVNLMTMYLPFGPALKQLPAMPALRTLLPPNERDQAIGVARQLGLHLLVDGR